MWDFEESLDVDAVMEWLPVYTEWREVFVVRYLSD
jgi:hypothetical protein